MNIQDFELLPRNIQLRRLRRLAQAALATYGLEAASLTPLQHFLNTTFRVDVPSYALQSRGDRGEKPLRYALRISRSGYQDASTIRSELLWLQAIQRDTNLVVPEPIPARDGSLLTTVSVPDVPEYRHCVVFRWVDGRFRNARLRPVDLVQVGRFMAQLHLHVQQYTMPEGFTRKRWDIEGLRGKALGIDPQKARRHLSPEQCRVLDAVADRAQQAMRALGQDQQVFGLIHADLHQYNYLFSKGNVRAIDFDTSGWGYYLYDIAVTFSTLLNRPNLPEFRAAFLDGYRQVRPLAAEYEDFIEIFTAARIMGHTLWVAAHIDEPAFGAKAAIRVSQQVEMLADFLKR